MSRLRRHLAYPPEWPEVSKETRRRAGYRCVRCGHPDPPWAEPRGLACDDRCTHPADGKMRILTTHHLDGEKANLRWWNLAALCQSCHLHVQGQVKMEQTYQLPHQPWFWPYVAGYYAWTVLGEDLTREQVEERLVELLAAGQPHLGEHYGRLARSGRVG